MHLLEAYLALEETAPGRGYIERAGAIVALFQRRLFDPRTGSLPEVFAADWSEHPDPARRSVIEPGHHFEWVWLLHRHAAMSNQDLGRWSTALFAKALDHGVAPSGLIVDEITRDGAVRTASHRVWPQAEALKAAGARHAAGDRQAHAFAQRVANAMLLKILDRPFTGGWIDHIDAGGAPLVDFVPASTLYHLVVAATEIETSVVDIGR